MMKSSGMGIGESTPSRVKAKAYGVQCQQYIGQMRMMWTINQMGEPERNYPTSLKDFEGAGDVRCPVSGMLYGFDARKAADGRTCGLFCPYPKHWTY